MTRLNEKPAVATIYSILADAWDPDSNWNGRSFGNAILEAAKNENLPTHMQTELEIAINGILYNYPHANAIAVAYMVRQTSYFTNGK